MAHDAPRPADVMFGMISGFWVSRVIHTVAKLEIPDHLAESPATAEALAVKTGMHAPSLYRVLRAAAAAGIFEEDADGAFSVTPLGATLRKDVPGSLHAFAVTELGGGHYRAWGDLMHSVRTGEIAFDHAHGMTIWEYFFERNPEDGQIFNASMTGLTGTVVEAVLEAYDFTPYRRPVDVGGGQGAFLSAVVGTNPEARGVLFDAPSVIAKAGPGLKARGVADRIETVSGSFFDSVPGGGDLYLLKWVLHDWNDDDNRKILQNVRSAMPEGARLVVVDTVVPVGNELSPSKFIDLDMMIANGGMERTEQQFRDLFEASGFRLERIIPTHSPSSVIEGVPIGD
ncbi:methyltransferase [Streptomyces sp. NPDC050759]|uniref:methyltransferase n=1 Tax=Streptomyces sp. NPDC050759 TaxID=3365635 RepID=UPI0037A45585